MGWYIFIFFQIVCKRKRFAKKSLIFLHILAILDTTSVYKNYTYVHDFASMKRIFRDTTNKHIWNPREIQNGFLHKKRKFLVENQMCIRRRKFSVFGSTFCDLLLKWEYENECSFFSLTKIYLESLNIRFLKNFSLFFSNQFMILFYFIFLRNFFSWSFLLSTHIWLLLQGIFMKLSYFVKQLWMYFLHNFSSKHFDVYFFCTRMDKLVRKKGKIHEYACYRLIRKNSNLSFLFRGAQ